MTWVDNDNPFLRAQPLTFLFVNIRILFKNSSANSWRQSDARVETCVDPERSVQCTHEDESRFLVTFVSVTVQEKDDVFPLYFTKKMFDTFKILFPFLFCLRTGIYGFSFSSKERKGAWFSYFSITLELSLSTQFLLNTHRKPHDSYSA